LKKKFSLEISFKTCLISFLKLNKKLIHRLQFELK
jgi:hypothetical protein